MNRIKLETAKIKQSPTFIVEAHILIFDIYRFSADNNKNERLNNSNNDLINFSLFYILLKKFHPLNDIQPEINQRTIKKLCQKP